MRLTMHGIPADFYIHNEYRAGKSNKSISSEWIKGKAYLYYAIINAKGSKRHALMLGAWENNKKN